ncbi:hypothetical protein BJ138DRAFT_987353, partial [Hygrophoropsis aurantiaca]
KRNDATECGITNGAEGYVAGWHAIEGPHGKQVLETLFVRLKNPTRSIQFDGLPINVVPLTRHNIATRINLPSGHKVKIKRDQILVLPNFAMTDYCSQGRTRPDNVVDLNNCNTHQSYY